MGRSRIGAPRKVKIGISLDADLYAWIAERTGPGREFASISHGIERSIAQLSAKSSQAERARDERDPPPHGRL